MMTLDAWLMHSIVGKAGGLPPPSFRLLNTYKSHWYSCWQLLHPLGVTEVDLASAGVLAATQQQSFGSSLALTLVQAGTLADFVVSSA